MEKLVMEKGSVEINIDRVIFIGLIIEFICTAFIFFNFTTLYDNLNLIIDCLMTLNVIIFILSIIYFKYNKKLALRYTIISLIFFFFGSHIIRFFIDDPDVIREGTEYLKIIALFEVFLGLEIVLEGAFSGAGNSLPPMLISVPLTWARIPLSLFFAHSLGMGSLGIWLAISLTTGLKGIVMAFWFRLGRWKTQQV